MQGIRGGLNRFKSSKIVVRFVSDFRPWHDHETKIMRRVKPCVPMEVLCPIFARVSDQLSTTNLESRAGVLL